MPSGEVTIGQQTRWAWWSLLPLGLGAWAPIYAGVRARRRAWSLFGVLLTIVAIAGWVAAIVTHGHSSVGGGLILLGWIGAIAISFSIRQAYARVLGSDWTKALESAETKLAERDRARRLARERPSLALEMGVGRPDLPGAHDAGLIDVNHAGASALAMLPGVDHALAERIVEVRGQIHGFSSAEDLGAAVDLDGSLVERLRDRIVFLPG
jgi:Helix-hairpin-helix motif